MGLYETLVHSPYEEMLVACLVARDAADLDRIDALYKLCQERRLFLFAREHECSSIVASRLRALGKATPEWEAEADEWKYRLSQRFEALDALAEALDAEKIPVVALRNAGIARGIYPHLEECPMGDFDILVRRSDFVRAHDVVMAQGFALDFRAEETIETAGVEAGYRSGGTEYKKELADDMLWLELQWRPVAGRWLSPEVEPSADDLMATSLAVDGTRVRILEPVMNLVQVCLHTAKHSYVRAPGLRLHTDVDRIVRAYPELDWQKFVSVVSSMHVKTAVYFSLAIPAALLGTPVPEDILAQLKPSKVKYEFLLRSIAQAGLFHPLRRKFSRPRYLAFTAMLFDSASVCFHTAFPSPRYMSEEYEVKSTLGLPLCYARRLGNLVFKRVKT